jgi:hypothetical protein
VTQVPNFYRLKFAVTAIRQGAEQQRSKGNSFQFNHFMTHAGQQPTNFAILAFLKFQFQYSTASLMPHNANALKPKEAFREIHPIPQLIQRLRCWPSGNMAAVSSHHFKSGVRQSLRKVPIIG